MEDQEPRMDLPPSITARPSPAWSQALPVAEVESELVALVARAKRGDREAYTLLYRRYLDDVYRFALGRLGNREAAEDAVQNIFVRALTALPSCHENAAFAVGSSPLRAMSSRTSCAPAGMRPTRSPTTRSGPIQLRDRRRSLCTGRRDASFSRHVTSVCPRASGISLICC
jgi:hypothetical protein